MHPLTTGTIEDFFQIVDLHLVYTRFSTYMKKCVCLLCCCDVVDVQQQLGPVKVANNAPPLLRQTLSHRSGLPGNADLDENDPLIRGSLSEVAEALVEYGLLAEPGTRYAYSEAGYKTAGCVAEVATGQSFEVLLKENILEPSDVVKEIRLPLPKTGQRSTYWKFKERGTWDFAVVSAAINGVISGSVFKDIKIVCGGLAPIPWRLNKAEDLIRGKKL